MRDLSPHAQAIIDSARSGEASADRAEKARIKRRVLARVAAATLASAAGTAATQSAASVGSASSVGAATSAGAAASGGGVASVGAAGSLAPAAGAVAGILGAKAVVVGVAASVLVAGSVAAGFVATRAAHAPPPPAVASVVAPAKPAPIVPTPPAHVDDPAEVAPPVDDGATLSKTHRRAGSTLEQELPLLQGAQEALRRGDSARALRLLDAHARRFPNGVLAPERRAVHAMAVCQANSGPAARAEAEAFVREAPGSPLVERVRSACLGGAKAHD
jgi:hypothetical protein